MGQPEKSEIGKVYLVGAGPGDPGMLTLRAVECLRRADVVLYDYLANPRALEYIRSGAEVICLGRHGGERIWTQDEINRKLLELAREGRTVVRLKGGDPAVFARGAEEAEILVNAGIPMEMVPGVTVALAAGSYAGIPVTHRKMASAVALITGQEHPDKSESSLDFDALARFPGTLVFYMGVTTAERWTRALIEAGKPPDTPVAIVRRCSLPDQLVVHCTLEEVTQHLSHQGPIRPPAIAIIGEVTTLGPTLSWFERRPLVGKRVMVTRPQHQAGSIRDSLLELGADVVVQPAVDISPPGDWHAVDRVLAQLHQFDWLVFSSANGVRFLLDRLHAIGRDLRALGGIRLAAIGPGTADELARYHLRADVQPEQFRAESLAAALAPDAEGKRFLLARASRGREVLCEQLTAAGGQVEQVVVYQSTDVTAASEEIHQQLSSGSIDWITVTSSAIARSLAALFGDDLRKSRLASISPVTSATLRELGFEPAVEAEQYTIRGIVDAIVGVQ